MEVAVTPWSHNVSWFADDLCEQAVLAEKMGFHSFWLPENHFGDSKAIPSPLTLLAAVAARTSRIKLGTTSYLLTIRNPIQAAEEVAVLDQLSKGRLILGVGRGVQDVMFKVFDLPVKDKRKIFQANLDIMRNAWQGQALLIDDHSAILSPLPHQKPYPPIWVAAFGPLALKQAGRLGLPYLASPVETLDTLKRNYSLHQETMEQAGHTKNIAIPIMRTVFVSDKKDLISKAKQALNNAPGHQMRLKDTAIEDWTIIGDAKYVHDKIQEYQESLGMTHLIARGRLPEIDNDCQLESHQRLITLSSLLEN
jgi:alkanesulfonate monooxygenase SsuD/methylene tetrahydromethanopterin reductase-like flavin-dependent oxidoreductase (luciferase family)